MKYRIVKLLLMITVLTLMNACASVPMAPPEADVQIKNMTPPPGKALLYVYRDGLFMGSAVIYNIYVDEQRIDGSIAVNTFLAVTLEPGEHRFCYVATHLDPAAIPSYLAENYQSFTVSAGKKYYVKISAVQLASETNIVNIAPEAFQGSRLIRRSVKPTTVVAATGNKDRNFSSPAAERRQSVRTDVDTLPQARVKADKNRYAIVIGIEEYREKLPKAEFAADDARLVSEYFTKALGVPEENLVVLTNGKATKSDMEKYFQRWLPNHVTKESEVFIYYSGHGAPNPSGEDAYLVPYDGDPTYITETGYPLKRLYEVLGRLPAKRNIVMLDSCFSGAGNRSVTAKGLRPLVVMAADQGMIASNTSVLAASAGNQVSSTYLDKGHGLMTYFILKGLKEEPVLNPDGRLDMERLYPYVKQNVERIARKQYNNEQTPQLIGAGK